MIDIFLKLLNMSLASGALIIAIIIFRFISPKTPKWIICLLWGLVAIRLICPFSVESFFGLIPSDNIVADNILWKLNDKMADIVGTATSSASKADYMNLENIYHTGTINDNANILPSVLTTVWICGALGILLYMIIMNFRMRLHLREAIPFGENIYLCDYVRSPFIFGLFHPHIYLPSDINNSDMSYVVAHERAHLQRKDHIWEIIAFLILAIYWFNPLSWLAFILFCKDIEFACDEKVIKNFNIEEKKAYCTLLLSCSLNTKNTIVYPLAFGDVEVKKRVKTIFNYKKPAFSVTCISIFCLILIGLCFLTNSPQKYKTTGLISSRNPEEIHIRRMENELEKTLANYDKTNIYRVYVGLQNSGATVTSAHVIVVGKDNSMEANKQDEMKKFITDYLSLDVANLDFQYANYEEFYSQQ